MKKGFLRIVKVNQDIQRATLCPQIWQLRSNGPIPLEDTNCPNSKQGEIGDMNSPIFSK